MSERSTAALMSKALTLCAAALLAGGGGAAAQQPRLHPVTWTLEMLSDLRGADTGVAGVAALRARIEPGWHLYSLTQPAGGPRATVIAVVSDPPFRLAGPIGRPAPDTIPDRTWSGVSETYADSVTFRLPIGARTRLPAGRRPLAVAVTFQVCSVRLCLAPHTDSLTATADVVR